MRQDEFLLKVGELVIKAAGQGYIPVKMAIGNRIVIVQDSKNEFDTYFDLSRFEFKQPEIWNKTNRNNNEIGILPGNGKYPRVSSFGEAILFASEHLRSKDRTYRFYPHLQSIN